MFTKTRQLCKCTAEGTFEYMKKFSSTNLRAYTSTTKKPFHMSKIGFGGYRVGVDRKSDQYALQVALQSGCNVIDTSTNYENGDSEMMIGAVLHGLEQESVIKRENIVVMSKVGYIQGNNMELAQRRERERMPFSGVVKVHGTFHWHCISPDFIQDQITASLDRLQLNTIDVLYLHNPEYAWTEKETPEAFYRKIKYAFKHLEKEVAAGRIQYYGISSNTFGSDPTVSGNISLPRCVQIAEELGNTHHFKFIQFPFNIEENNALLNQNCQQQSLLQYAASKNIVTVGNRPLNASLPSGNMIRYCDSTEQKVTEDSTKVALEECSRLINQTIYSEINTPFDRNTLSDSGHRLADPKMPHKGGVSWGQILAANLDQLDSMVVWRDVVENRIRPELTHSLQMLRRHPNGEQYANWSTQYNYILHQMITAYEKFLVLKHQREADEIKETLDNICPDLTSSPKLVQKVMRVLCSTPIDTMLIGMRKPEYVNEIANMGPPIASEQALEIVRSVTWPNISMEQGETKTL